MSEQETDAVDREPVPREQLETALEFLEVSHGEALRRPWSDEALALYQAIDILQGAMNEELRHPDEANRLEHEVDAIERSRKARDEGYAAATLLDERTGTGRVESVAKRDQPETLLGKVRQLFE